MTKHITALLFATAAWSAEPKAIASYDIKAALDTTTHIITGSEVLTWLNDSRDTVPALQFHLYMNAFKNEKSTFMRESGGGQLRGDRFKGKEWGWIDVKRMQIAGGADLTKSIRFIQPDDGNKDDQTVIEVPLPQPVKPGETLRVEIDFVTKMPTVFARTGFHGNFYLVGQWFPKLGVWETAGFRYSQKGAWNCHQFHAHSEFFANFGNYRAELTAPKGWVIGATGGVPVKVIDDVARKTSTYTFEQENVTDFAWTVQPNFIRRERTFVADTEAPRAEVRKVARLHGITEDEARLSDVRMIALVQPEHSEQVERHLDALRAALKGFGLRYGRYPFKTITVVDPPYGGGGAGGMEYPTFITAGTSWRSPSDFHGLEEVTVHEFGHQFWMQLVANNEFEESWLDEGFNTYSTTLVMEEAYGPTALPAQLFGVQLAGWLGLPKLRGHSINRAAFLAAPAVDDMVRRAWEYFNSNSYGVNSYMKPGTVLRTLENILGADTMARVMRTYHQRWRFGHPTSHDFLKLVNEAAGRDMTEFFDQFIFGNKLLDYSVRSVATREVKTFAGVFDEAGKRLTVAREDAEKRDREADKKDSKRKKLYESTVKVFREQDGVMPVELEVHFKDGSVEKRTWDGRYRWAKFEFLKPSEVDWVEIDPARKYRIDVNWTNNSWQSKPQPELTAAWSSRILFWMQNLLLMMSAGV
jgi:hypothetical protein